MEIIPNLHFRGDCENAIALYERAFNGRKTVFLRYKDANPQDVNEKFSVDVQEYVYHNGLPLRPSPKNSARKDYNINHLQNGEIYCHL